MERIIEDFEEKEITEEEANRLVDADKIYWCGEDGCYHTATFVTLYDVDEFLKNPLKVFKIKVTGSGTKRELIVALNDLLLSIEEALPDELENGVNWEDKTLYTQISIDENEEE